MRNLSSEIKKCLIVCIIVLIVFIIGGSIFYVYSVKKVRKECSQVNEQMSGRIDGATRVVYRALADIAQGQAVTADLVEVDSQALTDTSQGLLMDEGDLGKQATVSITAGEDIHKGMVGEPLEKEWQETELNCVWLSTNLKQYDYVDIRVLFPNGTDYVVAAKKSVQGIKLSKNNAFFWFTEDEILNVDSAIVDANLHGAKIYTTKYVDPALEKANEVTYQPSDAVIDLLNSSPNVLAEAKENLSKVARAEMEEKLDSFKDNYTEQQQKELEENYDFHLDTTTDGGTGEVSENNNGSSEEVQEDGVSDAPVDSAANVGAESEGD